MRYHEVTPKQANQRVVALPEVIDPNRGVDENAIHC
jgi:hypothetical protein